MSTDSNDPPSHPAAGLRVLVPPAAAALLVSVLTLWLLGVAPWELVDTRLISPFHDGHVWAFEQVWQMLLGSEDLSGTTTRIGYPGPVLVRLIGWCPALLALPLQPLLGPLGAYNVVMVASPSMAVLAAWALLRRTARLDSWTAAGLALSFGLCPYALGVLQSGQVAKLQHWLLPACLLAVSHAVRGPHRLPGVLACAVGGLAMAFTTPSTALFLPIAAGLWVLAELIGARPRWQPAMLGWCVAALAALAGGMLPARLYLGDLRQAGMLLAFEPRASGVTQLTALPYPVPMAQPEGLFLGLGGLAQQAWDASHVVYLGLPMLVLGVLLGLRRGPGRAAGWALLLGGIIVALGPMLVSGDAFVLWDDRRLRLPAALLEALHYPTRTSGMYYRAVVLAALGLPLLVASGWPRRRAWWWAALAWLLALLHVGDGWRITRELWPPPSGPVPGEALLVAMAEDPQPGAVLDLPIEGGTWEGGNAMIAATIHGRATTAMPRQTSVRYLPQTARLATLFERALAAEEPLLAQALLADRGFRYLCWRPWLGEHGRLAALEGALGPALGDEQLYCWPLEPDPRL